MRTLAALFLLLSTCTSLSAHPPWGIAVDKTGNIFFTDIAHNGRGSVWMVGPDGTVKLLLSDFHSHNVNLMPNGDLVVAHGEETHTLVRLSFNATRTDVVSIDTLISTTDIKQFNGGTTYTAPSGNTFFQIDKYIWKLDARGRSQRVSRFKLEWNQCLYVDATDVVYAPDIGRGNGQIYKVKPGGGHELVADDLISKLDRPRDRHNDVLLGMAMDAMGDLYVCELAGKRVVKIDADGGKSTFYRGKDNWAPTGLTFKRWNGLHLDASA